MEYLFFYISIIALWIIFLVLTVKKPLNFKSYVTGITTIAYSLTFETILGVYFGLYYYVNPKDSIIYIVISAILIYPLLNIIYIMFLPQNIKSILTYTAIWIVGMLIFEYGSVVFKTVVFTGWKPVPWSIVTYIVTYMWINILIHYIDLRQTTIKTS